MTPAAQAKHVEIRTRLEPDAGPVRGDPERLHQVTWNLLSNAVKFTPQGGAVRVELVRRDGRAELSVADSGQGIDRAFLPFVFERFRQADSSTTRRHGGLGLGLSIVRHLVEMHGGSVAASSDGPGAGATFLVSLPLLTDLEADSEPAATGPAAPADSGELSGLRVLVVDDQPDARRLLDRLLARQGARVALAGSVAEAVTALDEAAPDVVVSDIGMPGADGYELIRLITERVSAPPAIALSAFARPEDRDRALRAGFRAHLSKPVDPAELLAAIHALMADAGPP